MNKTLSSTSFIAILFVYGCSMPAEPVFDKEFNLSLTTEGGGNVSQRVLNEANYDQGQPKQVELQPQPAEDWEFSGWSGDASGSANPLILALNSNKRVTAIFELECGPVTFTYDGSEVTYGSVMSETGRCWLDRNLGASRVAQSSTDSQAYGDLFQWGRGDDGHQRRNSSTTSTLSNSDQPNHGNFILAPDSPYDWRSPQNSNLWQGVNGINNPCPSGYRLPTEAEWETERQSWSSNTPSGAFNSPLRLHPLAGYRNNSSGSLFIFGFIGFYWSGTVDGSLSQSLGFGSGGAGMSSNLRASGFSVRCLKN